MKAKKVRKNSCLVLAIALSLGCCLHGGNAAMAAATEVETAPQETADAKAAAGEAEIGFDLDGVTVEAKRPDWESKLSPGTVTVIRPDERNGEQKSMADLLKEVPGVHVREVNGHGHYTTVSVRGSTAAQVGIFVDGVLYNLGGDSAADISTIPIDNVERIEVYRGYIPARFGGTYMGGVINVVTKRPDKAKVHTSLGKSSYGGYKANLQIDNPLGKGSLMLGVNHERSDGDFKYNNYYAATKRYDYVKTQYDQYAGFILNAVPNSWDMGDMLFNEMNGGFGTKMTEFNDLCNEFYNGDASQARLELFNMLQNNYDYFASIYYDKYHSNMTIPKDFHNWAEKVESYKDGAPRWRRYNDYRNTDVIAKYQDEHWMVKGTYKNIDRHMPNTLAWSGGASDAGYDFGSDVDTDVIAEYTSERKQEIISKDILAGWRNQAGNLEWGISLNYLDKKTSYRNLSYQEGGKGAYWNTPFRAWSNYKSDRYGGKIDGTYKAGDNHLIEFMANFSKEELNIKGDKVTDGKNPDPVRYRTNYKQDLLNLQIQDTITLDKKGTFWFTPSIFYNSGQIFSKMPPGGDPHIWYNNDVTQKDSKTTWQLALKKQFSDSFTLRATGGTYYRLLNLYEIAGDGGGILPAPRKDINGNLLTLFPLPEEGKQWDISAIWDTKVLGADSKIQLTYFGRNSENLLQLWRYGYDFWSYSNSAEGRSRGLELQMNMNWEKWDLDLAGTYLDTSAKRKDDSPTGGNTFYDIKQTYQPRKEGSLRLAYRPDDRTMFFSEIKYVGEMYTYYGSENFTTGQESLTTIGLGAKHKFNKGLELIVGVNDIFNKGPKLHSTINGKAVDRNIEYPLQGRTYYATVQYNF